MSSILEPGIFRHPRLKKSIPFSSRAKCKFSRQIDEISFDTTSREDYLTGFHKRKLARVKNAQAEAEKKLRQERISLRKKLREERNQALQDHVDAVNTAVNLYSGHTIEEELELRDTVACNESSKDIPSVLETINYEDFTDEDKQTTVTIEAVNISKDGIHKNVKFGDNEIQRYSHIPSDNLNNITQKCPKKLKKKKFRYGTKAERKILRLKEKSGRKKYSRIRQRDK